MSREVEVRRWWRVVVHTVAGSVFIDDAESREEALEIAEREDAPGWPESKVIEFTERGRDRESERIR